MTEFDCNFVSKVEPMNDQTDQLDASFWREQLSGNLPILDLPLDHRRTAKPSYEYGQAPFQVPADVARQIDYLAEREGASLSSMYLAAYAILLSRYGNAQELLIGFTNCAVIRADCAPERSFTRLVREIADRVSTIRQHQAIPLGLLEQLMNVPAAPGCAPVCDAHFDWESTETAQPLHPACDLILRIRERGERITPSVLYRKDLFDSSTIERMTRHFVRLLQSIVSDVEAPIGELDMMPDEERALVLGAYSGSEAEYPRRCLHELFEEQAALYPDAEALVFGAERLTYRQLDQRSNQIAQFLRQQGIQHEDRVGIFMDRSIGMVVSMLGILKAGGAYVPIDPDYPAERLKFIADDTEVRCVFTEKTVRAKLPTTAPLVYLDGPDSPIARCGNGPVPNISTPESIAVAIYTSGSTGQPKAACIPHRAAVRLVRNTNFVQATSEDRISQVSSPSFDAAILEIWSALTNGAALIGIRKEVLLDPAEVTKLLRAERITILFVNTAYVHQIGRDAPEVLKGPRKIMFGGEAAEPGPLRNILRHVPPGTLVNLYGPAENSVVSSSYEIHSVPEDSATISIGRPITNTRMYLLDKGMHLVPIGLQGEIYVGGDGVARGYWNRPELTAQRFIPDPFSDNPGALLYRTGDLARMRENGEFEFNGRIDDQIKIHGHRIELAEVREAIVSHGAVKQVALLVREDEPGDRRLVAYVTLRQPLDSPLESLRQHVKEKLPSHMRPAAFVILDSIPLNTNGKVNRKALPPPSSRPEMATGYSLPQTGLEHMLAKVWQELLGVDRVGVNDNFFDLGGHSLLAARLIARIEKETGQNIPVATLFEAPTISELAQKLKDHTYASAWAPLVELRAPAGTPAAAPFFCIHSLGANLVSFHKLASLLRADRAVYGLQPHGLDGKQQPLDTVDAMAAAYLEEIRKKQPHGPYYLGGICLGGVIAYDAARRLEAAGEEVRLLALVDSFLPGQTRYIHTRSKMIEYLDFHLGEMLLLSGTARLQYLARWFGNGFIRLGWALGFRSRDSVARATRHVAEANVRAMLGYSPQPYAGTITQLMCSDWAERAYEDRRLAWSSVAAGGLDVHIVPGNHLTMVEEPHVRALAHELQACLDRADGLALPVQASVDSQHALAGAASTKSSTPTPKREGGAEFSGFPLSI
jgi:amino acid adenylation domain-containing protein